MNHINRILSITTGLDTTLLTLTYTMHLLHSRLSRLSTLSTPAPIAKHPTPPSKARLALRPHLAHTVRGMSKLADLIDDFRIFLRLWGLLGILAWAKSVSETPPHDTILHTITWAQIVVNTLYQLLENGAYLASHHVLPRSEQKVNRWYLWSSRFWMGHVGLEFVRLAREWALRKLVAEARGGKAKELGAKLERVREEGQWWREVRVNAAYAPLTVHWSVDKDWVGERVVGGLGMVAGWIGLRELWRRTG
ncbi:Peroxisomal biogenesis factor 11 [Lasallia pustulata]|uniref:Peroxisomal biogenesis factor 11 n=1 Tax=Lasallia pustulata TaxID=136370 RepID=A0A1W5D4L2_9LECA|nr:Peroxisomal biogenesis factor 11 [Lasallia pustulata]